ncbi:1417_t:CDS:1, partial [Dentiscutata erythropus]
NVYIKLVQLASAIHHISIRPEYSEFQNICVKFTTADEMNLTLRFLN